MRRAVPLILCLMLILPLLAACGAPGTVAQTSPATAAPTAAEQTAAPQDTQTPEETPPALEPTTILLMGIGDATYEPGESYPYALTHILITLDPADGVIKVTTLPYNLAVMAYAEGHELGVMQLQRVCASVGPDGTVETLDQNLGIAIDHYIVMNMLGVKDIVDALGGLRLNVDRLSINRASEYLMPFLGLTWEEVTATGEQLLTGIQTLGFFCDTYTDEGSADPLTEEEQLFRDRHPKILNAVAAAVKGAGLTADDLLGIAGNLNDRFTTDIPQEQWPALAETALYCLQNPIQYLHVPADIQLTDINGWTSIAFDPDADPAAVQAFIGQ